MAVRPLIGDDMDLRGRLYELDGVAFGILYVEPAAAVAGLLN